MANIDPKVGWKWDGSGIFFILEPRNVCHFLDLFSEPDVTRARCPQS